MKAPKAITHEAKLACSRAELEQFLDQVAVLEEQLGPILFQLPPSFQFAEDPARKFFSMLRELHSGDIVCEPRHDSWFQPVADRVLNSFHVARVAADPACVPDASRPGGWQGLCYHRLHGSPRRYYSTYPSEFLKTIAGQSSNNAARNVWCIFDNTASGAAITNALELAGMWSES